MNFMKTADTSFNLIKQDDDDLSIIDNIYLFVKDSNKVKYQYLVKNVKEWFSKYEDLVK